MTFKEHLKKYLDDRFIDSLIASFTNKEQKGIYLNTFKMSNEDFVKKFPDVIPHPVVSNGYLYDKDQYPLGNNIYHELGAYYIQDPSAMMVSNFLNIKEGMKILDLCASPGGKTIQAALKLNHTGIVVANDISKSRAITLLSNIERLGLDNVMVTSLDFSKIYKDYQNTFDAIIVDAPCSGSGMFRKSDAMKEDWTYEKVLKNAYIQKELILMAYSMLKEGGELIYSTCSYSYEEDEEIVDYLLDNSDAISVPLPHFDGEYREKNHKNTIHLFPNLFKGEGQYIALFKKPGELVVSKESRTVVEIKSLSKGGVKQIEKYILNSPSLIKLSEMSLRPGLFVSTKINNEKEIWSHHYSHSLKDDERTIEVDLKNAKRFILGESINIDKCDDGYYFPSFEGMPLGVIHIVNNKNKNLYPKGLRKRLLN